MMNGIKNVWKFGRMGTLAWQVILLFIAVVLAFIASKTNAYASAPGLMVNDASITVGAMNDSPDTQVIHYSVTLQNNDTLPVIVDALVPVMNGNVAKMITPKDPQVVVDQQIKPGGTLGVNSELQFDSRGVTKDQINQWGKLITGFKVTTEQILPSVP
jgi:hypothetical protein